VSGRLLTATISAGASATHRVRMSEMALAPKPERRSAATVCKGGLCSLLGRTLTCGSQGATPRACGSGDRGFTKHVGSSQFCDLAIEGPVDTCTNFGTFHIRTIGGLNVARLTWQPHRKLMVPGYAFIINTCRMLRFTSTHAVDTSLTVHKRL
jgi:hypothetical protein